MTSAILSIETYICELQTFTENWDKWEMTHASPPDDPQTYRDGRWSPVELRVQPTLHGLVAEAIGRVPHPSRGLRSCDTTRSMKTK